MLLVHFTSKMKCLTKGIAFLWSPRWPQHYGFTVCLKNTVALTVQYVKFTFGSTPHIQWPHCHVLLP